ncbi:MAG: LicD family protein [Clostridia bacterium]|nr:LicD family protein [Clostridia bacterium]
MRKLELSEVQDIIYGIFVKFDRICRKHNIKYSMEGGTLLGAVKYQNFVPWDDDIDVIMKREEYERFLSVAPGELGDGYLLQSYHSAEEFPLNYAKLCYTGAVIRDYDYSHLTKMCHGIFMDIFPIDNVKPDKLRAQCSFVGVFTGARKTKLKVRFGKMPTLKCVIYKSLSLLPMKALNRLVDIACKRYNKEDTGYRYEVCNSNRKFKPLPADIYDELVELPFRDGSFLAVKEYDAFLRSRFGEDYMDTLPSEEERRPSHCSNIYVNE